MKKTVLLKLSGEALGKKESIYDVDRLNELASQVKKLASTGNYVGIVTGGGNMIRGKEFSALGFDRVDSDNIGMIATCMNCLVFKQALEKHKQKAVVMASFAISGCEPFDNAKVKEYFKKGYVVLFAGGIGNPYFSTDTACALRAIEIKADLLLIAKHGVDGVYDSDPKTNPKAKRFATITYDEIIDKKLGIIDLTAALLLSQNKVKSVIFDMSPKDNIIKVIDKPSIGTIIK